MPRSIWRAAKSVTRSSAYRAHGRMIGSELKAQAVESLIADWNRDYDPGKTSL
jgi:hypothetical protein